MNACPYCQGTGIVTGYVNLEPTPFVCHPCKRAGRLSQEDDVKPLPSHLIPFVRMANADSLKSMSLRPASGKLITNPNIFVRAWSIEYLIGDRDQALQMLQMAFDSYNGKTQAEKVA